jgi:GH24 family phage-related lysozyme (muramidase)
MSRKLWNKQSVPTIAYVLFDRLVGCETLARPDEAGKLSIGYGFEVMPDGSPVKEGASITPEQANGQLAAALAPITRTIVENATWQLNEAQAAVLMYFCHLHGVEALEESLLGQMISEGDLQDAGLQLLPWPKDDATLDLMTMRENEFLRSVFTGTMQADRSSDWSSIQKLDEKFLEWRVDTANKMAEALGYKPSVSVAKEAEKEAVTHE